MDSATEEVFLQKMEELVFDEDKIITISILGAKLDICLTEAKQLLEKFVSDQKINPGKISVTYLISGKLKKGDYGIQIVDGVSLKEKRELFAHVTNEVVYSIQKNNSIDFNMIVLAEKSEIEKPFELKGSTVSKKCTERVIKTKILPPLPPQKNFEKQKSSSSFFKPLAKPQSNGDVEKKAAELSTKNELKTQSQKKSGGLANFLSQTSQNSKKEDIGKVKTENTSDEIDSRELKRVKSESNNSEKVIKNEEVQVNNEKQEKVKDNFSKKEIMGSEEIEEMKSNKVIKNKKTPKKESNGKKAADAKKRKRIIIESDSDDDLFGKDDDERMEVIESDEEKPALVLQPKAPVVPKNKRRKAVEKTYEDEEGYVVTKTEYILVSPSEDEEEESTKPSKNENEKPKILHKTEPMDENKSLPGKGGAKAKKGKSLAANQPTLMNFFKKK